MAANISTTIQGVFLNSIARPGAVLLPSSFAVPGRILTLKDQVGAFSTNVLRLSVNNPNQSIDSAGRFSTINQTPLGWQTMIAGNTNRWFTIGGTLIHTLNPSTLNAGSLSSFQISTAQVLLSSIAFEDQFNNSTNTLYVQSTFLIYQTGNQSTIIGGTRQSFGQIFLPASRQFQPTQISGLRVWLDASDPNTISNPGSFVSTWLDKSGSGFHATQTTSANQPVFFSGNSNLNFTRTSSQFLRLPNDALPTGNSSYGYFVVLTWRQAIDGLGIIGGGGYGTNNAVFALRSLGAGTGQVHQYWWFNDLTSLAGAYTANVPLIVECTYTSGGARAILINGTQNVTDNPVARAQTNANNTVGAVFITSGTPEYHDGTISEILVYSNALTTLQRQQVEGYLAWKWGQVANLPSTHPYKISPP